MPFYLFSMRLVAKDKFGQEISDKLQQFVRQIDNRDIDNVWRQYKKKAETHYGSKLCRRAIIKTRSQGSGICRFPGKEER